MAEIAVNLLAKNLKELLSSKIDWILEEKDKIQILYEDLQLLRTNLNDLQVKFFEQEQVKNLEARIRDLAYEAENTIDSFLVNIFSRNNFELEEIMKDDSEEEIKSDDSEEEIKSEYDSEEEIKSDDSEEEIKSEYDSEEEIKSDDSEEEIKSQFDLSELPRELPRVLPRVLPRELPRELPPELPPFRVYDSEKESEYNFSKPLESRDSDSEEELKKDPLVIYKTFLNKYRKQIKKDRSLKDEIKEDDHALNLEHVKEEIEAIKTEMIEIYDSGLEAIPQVGSCSSSGDSYSSKSNTNTWGVGEEEIMVGFEDEAMILKEQLTGGPKRLQVISIVGMAGQGKTTLARKLYNDPLVVYHFYIRAWTSVSQEYQKRDLLIRILNCVMKHTNGIDQMGDEKLCEKLYKSLKGRTYFIVMDDIWDTKAWVDLKNCFPNDNNGSRIMFTSRHEDVVLQAKTNSPPLSLRFLTHNESWDLLQHKVFGKRENCPPELMEIGKQIAKKCQGLPLAIVLVAGIFTNEEKSQGRWKQVGETLNSNLAANPQLWKKTLELSYNHLPGYLKPCLLCFGAFPEDYQIRVKNLIWLWVAEGFITKTGEKRLEDVAKEYLMDLIGRSLLLVSKRGCDGEIKACGVHDLLHEFCIKQGEEDFFLQRFLGYQRISVSTTSGQNIRSLLFFNSGCAGSWYPRFLSPCFRLLKVLDTSFIQIFEYPIEVEQLVLLRYLTLDIVEEREIQVSDLDEEDLPFILPPSISNLCYLETLILCTSHSSVYLPPDIWTIENLRHLCVSGNGKYIIINLPDDLPLSDNLQTLSWVSCEQEFSVRSPNLKKLGFRGCMVHEKSLMFPDLDFLDHLQELKLWNEGVFNRDGHVLGRIKLPLNLTKLTLKNTYLKWDEMSTLGKSLPNLEGLKLLYKACIGKRWETSDGEFPRLKFLKLKHVQVDQLEVSSNHFPVLQRLVLIQCDGLKKIPSEMGDIPTLQMIEVHWCHPSLANSAKEIKEEQESIGNNWLQMIESNNNVL